MNHTPPTTPSPQGANLTPTPRTDAEFASRPYTYARNEIVLADFARTLERELAKAAHACRDTGITYHAELARALAESAQLRQELEGLRAAWNEREPQLLSAERNLEELQSAHRLAQEELGAYRIGGVTEEILRRGDGFIKVGNGCAIVAQERVTELEQVGMDYHKACVALDKFIPFMGVDNCERIKKAAEMLAVKQERVAELEEKLAVIHRNLSPFWAVHRKHHPGYPFEEKWRGKEHLHPENAP